MKAKITYKIIGREGFYDLWAKFVDGKMIGVPFKKFAL